MPEQEKSEKSNSKGQKRDDLLSDLAKLSDVESETFDKLYRLAELAAISRVKAALGRWLLLWIGVLTVVIAILSLVGYHELLPGLRSSMSEDIRAEISKELYPHRLTLIQSTVETSRDLGVAVSRAESTLKEMTAKKKEVDEFVKLVAPVLNDFREIGGNEGMLLAFRRLVAEFYQIREMNVHVSLRFSETLEDVMNLAMAHLVTHEDGLDEDQEGGRELREHSKLAPYVDLLRLNEPNRALAQFRVVEESVTGWTRAGTRIGFAYDLAMFPPTRYRLRGKNVDLLVSNTMRVVRTFKNKEQAQNYQKALQKLESLDVELVVNGIVVMRKLITNFEWRLKTTDAGKYRVWSTIDLGNALHAPRLALEGSIREESNQVRRDN